MNQNWTLHPYTDQDAQAWDDFVLNHPHGSIHQCVKWRAFQQQIPGREQVLGFYATAEDGSWLGATWCVKMSTGALGTHWYYSARGPVLTEDPKFRAAFLTQVSTKLKKRNGLFWRLDPYWQEDNWQSLEPFTIHHSPFTIRAATKNFQPTDSLMLDLTLSEDELKAGMKRNGRKALRLAEAAGVEVRIFEPNQVNDQHLEAWSKLNQETTSRDGFAGHDKSYYQKFIQTLAPYTYLCLAQHDKKTVAAAILTVCQSKAIYYFGASSSDPTVRDLRAPYALQWAMILKAKALGATTYDFTGITPEDQPNHPYKGITQFKTRFGGYRDTYTAGKEIVLRPWWYALYRGVKKLK